MSVDHVPGNMAFSMIFFVQKYHSFLLLLGKPFKDKGIKKKLRVNPFKHHMNQGPKIREWRNKIKTNEPFISQVIKKKINIALKTQ